MTTTEHPWQSARDKFNAVTLPRLKSIGRQIGSDADTGNSAAKDVIKYYSMLHASFDPMTFMQLETALKEYNDRH